MATKTGKRLWNEISLDHTRERIELNLNPNRDFYFFPFYAAAGFADRRSRISATEILFNSVLTGKKSVILKWLGAEQKLSFVDGKIKRNFQIGEHFIGKLQTSNFAQSFEYFRTGLTNAAGENVQFLQQTTRKRVTVVTSSDFFANENEILDPQVLNLFWMIPEIAENDIFTIETADIFRNKDNSISFIKLHFVSLSEKLKKLNRILTNLINFNEPGGWAPLPIVKSPQANNDSFFFDPNLPFIENEKKVWFRKPIFEIGAAGVKYVQIEYDGLVGISSLQFFGRKIGDNFDEIGEKTKPLLIYDFKSGFGKNDLSPTGHGSVEFTAVQGKLQHLQWFQDWKSEYGYYFDPLKTRKSDGVLTLKKNDDFFLGQNFFLNDNAKKNLVLEGKNNLRFNPFFQFNPRPTIFLEQNVVKFPDNHFEINSARIPEFLNNNANLNYSIDILEYEGVKKTNLKSFATEISNSAFSAAGSLNTAGNFGFTGALNYGQKFLNIFTRWLSNSWFDSEQTYTDYASETNFLLPTEFLKHVWNKLGRDKLIPLTLFENAQNNFLGGLAATKQFNCSFFFELTDKFSGGQNTDFFSRSETTNFLNTENPLFAEPSENTFAIDSFNSKVLGNQNYRITFFDSSGQKIWEQSRLLQSTFSGKLREWSSWDYFSDYNENDLSEEYQYRFWQEKTPLGIWNLNSDNHDVALKVRSEAWILNQNIVNLKPSKNWNFIFPVKFVTDSYGRGENNLWNYRFDYQSQNKNILAIENFSDTFVEKLRDFFEKNPDAAGISPEEKARRKLWNPNLQNALDFLDFGNLNLKYLELKMSFDFRMNYRYFLAREYKRRIFEENYDLENLSFNGEINFDDSKLIIPNGLLKTNNILYHGWGSYVNFYSTNSNFRIDSNWNFRCDPNLKINTIDPYEGITPREGGVTSMLGQPKIEIKNFQFRRGE